MDLSELFGQEMTWLLERYGLMLFGCISKFSVYCCFLLSYFKWHKSLVKFNIFHPETSITQQEFQDRLSATITRSVTNLETSPYSVHLIWTQMVQEVMHTSYLEELDTEMWRLTSVHLLLDVDILLMLTFMEFK